MYGSNMWGGYPQGSYRPRKTTKQDIKNFIQQSLNASEMVMVDEFETERARHVCLGTNQIKLLDRIVYPFQTESGVVNIEYFYCSMCRKVIVNKYSLDIL